MNNSLLCDPHQRKLLKKWGAILESGKKIQSETTKIALAQILENTRNYYKMHGMLNEAGVMSQGDAVGPYVQGQGVLKGDDRAPYVSQNANNGDFYLPNVVMPMLRRIMPDLIANDLVGVQPLNGPVGYALAYRPLVDGHEVGYEPVNNAWTGVTSLTSQAGYNASTSPDANYLTAYAGAGASWDGVGMKTGDAEWMDLHNNQYGNKNDYNEYDGYGPAYKTVSFGLVKSAVEAKTRKLAAHWSPELAEDMQAMHGIDVEREMVNTLTYEVGAEIDRQIITEMVKAAICGGSVSEWTPLSADGLDQMGRLATLLTQITVEANQIAIRTRRGNANFVVTTPRICALLQQMSLNKFTSFKSTDAIPTVPDSGVGALAKVGLINDDQQLLVRDSYATSKADYVLLGYKGKQAGDSGIIYCPYIPLQLSKVMQPGTFTPSIGARTRYGVMSNPWDARNFYHFMKIDTLSQSYTWDGSRNFIAAPSKINVTAVPTVYPAKG